jgi:hypothetical protein|tara:strand:- start:160 stop:699 length:540 start_codon:yes stop_codon:yes gene_type:complete
MKKLLILLSIISTSFVNAQEFPISEKTGKVSYEGVVKIDSLSAQEIYSRANEWFAITFNSAQSVIQMNDAEAKKIIGKGSTNVMFRTFDGGQFFYTISFFAKEGRYKYIITDIYHKSSPANPNGSGGDIANETPSCKKWYLTIKQWSDFRTQAETNINLLIDNLNQYMNKTNTLDDDDW